MSDRECTTNVGLLAYHSAIIGIVLFLVKLYPMMLYTGSIVNYKDACYLYKLPSVL